MRTALKSKTGENPFKKILDDAGRALDGTVDNRFLDSLPDSTESDDVQVPFPYGAQPETKRGWK